MKDREGWNTAIKTAQNKGSVLQRLGIKPCPFCGKEAVRYEDAEPCKRYELVHDRDCFIIYITKRMVTHIPAKNKEDGRNSKYSPIIEDLSKLYVVWNQRTL